jgi:hypothetical protein
MRPGLRRNAAAAAAVADAAVMAADAAAAVADAVVMVVAVAAGAAEIVVVEIAATAATAGNLFELSGFPTDTPLLIPLESAMR